MKQSIQSHIFTEVKHTVEKHRMFEKVKQAIVAFSGGTDSVCLLNVIHSLYKNKVQCNIMYVNHGLRTPSVLKEEENLTKYYAVKYNMKCKIVRVQVKKGNIGIEAAAREARYAVLQQYMEDAHASCILLGHNSDDVVETFLMNMIRGSGAAGLSAMAPVRLPFIRPLFYIRKNEICKYVRAKKLSFSEDKTNENLEYRRNLLRHKIIPQLLKINPEFHSAVLRTIQLIQQDNVCLDEYVEEVYKSVGKQEQEHVVLDIKKLLNYNPAVVGRIIRQAIKDINNGLEGFESKHIAALVSLKDKSSNKRIDLPKQLYGQREFNTIVIGKKHRVRRRSIRVDPKGDVVKLDSSIVRIRTEERFDLKKRQKGCEVFDLDKLVLPLEFRPRRQGDVLKTRVGKRMLKKIYSEQKIPPHRRAELMMFCDQRGILMIPGVARAYRGYVKKETRRFLVVDHEYTS